MILHYQLPITTILVLLGPVCIGQLTTHNRRRINARRQYKEYKELLKAANRTSFHEGDIRNLIMEGHEFARNNRKVENTHPDNVEVVEAQVASTSNMATVSRRSRKNRKHSRKNRKHNEQIATAHVTTSSSMWKKKMFAMRREEGGQLLETQSNELKPIKFNQDARLSKKERRKERRRKSRRRPIARPIKGQAALSLNIVRLKQRCKTKPMKQEIKVEGCLSKYIMNNLCYGQCNSFYIPEIRGKGNGPPSFISCGFCKPKTVRPVYVTLRCTNRRGKLRRKRKKVNYVKKCRCMEQEIPLDSL